MTQILDPLSSSVVPDPSNCIRAIQKCPVNMTDVRPQPAHRVDHSGRSNIRSSDSRHGYFANSKGERALISRPVKRPLPSPGCTRDVDAGPRYYTSAAGTTAIFQDRSKTTVASGDMGMDVRVCRRLSNPEHPSVAHPVVTTTQCHTGQTGHGPPLIASPSSTSAPWVPCKGNPNEKQGMYLARRQE